MWYGVSTIAARMLTFLLTPYLTYTLKGSAGQYVFGQNTYIYTIFPILNVLYTYGMETAYFRFSTSENEEKLYRTQMTSMLITTLFFSSIFFLFSGQISELMQLDNTTYLGWFASIIALDAMSALPFAKLRRENRPRKYAATKVLGIITYVVTIIFLFTFGDEIVASMPDSFFATWYHKHWGIGFILFANLLQAAVTLSLLLKELVTYRFELDPKLLKRILLYSWPILISGFAGQINDNINRSMYMHLYKGDAKEAMRITGFYGAAIRLSVFIQLGVQAFKMAAEPFFFSIAGDKDAKPTYARVMKWFVVILALMFLNVMLFLDIWKYFVGPEYRSQFNLVPILLLANIFIGIYYNLTVWYKLTDKTNFGAYIMLVGASVTVIFNWIFIPFWGYTACAWGLLLCNGSMMYLSFMWGQKYYPIPYEVGKMAKYLGVMLLLYGVQALISRYVDVAAIRIASGTVLFAGYLFYIFKQEQKELKSFPFIGKYVR